MTVKFGAEQEQQVQQADRKEIVIVVLSCSIVLLSILLAVVLS